MSEYMPSRTHDSLTVENLNDETLIYRERDNQAFCLNAVSAEIWRLCDGTRTIAMIASLVSGSLQQPGMQETVSYAIVQLQDQGLISAPPLHTFAVPLLLSRRQLIDKLGSRALLMLPVVSALAIPRAANALSGIVTDARRLRSQDRRAVIDDDQNPGSSLSPER